MFFSNWRRNRALGRECWQRFQREQDNITAIDLRKVKMIGPPWDQRPYVGQVGLFTEDMMTVNIPDLTWYCRADGNIWSEWYVRAPYKSKLWSQEIKRRDTYNNGDIQVRVPMTQEQCITVNRFTQEFWTMHKLGSYTLL